MKKVLILLVAIFSVVGLNAQTFDPMEVIPSDSSVRVGVMPNGITYYIKSNPKPEKRADFHIYYKVGAIQEQDSQNGLAHFLEHMAFNGSKNFPDNSLIDYLASIGVRFGENLNAGTGQEQTTYMITNVPITRPSIVDSALLVLHDWAGFISLDTADIDKERGVIVEEWRQGQNASRRLYEKQAPILYNNSLYARRNVIGNADVIKNFKYDELRDFYHKWYRPDMQAFVIVGDFDADSMEAKLLRTMADIQPAAQRAPREDVYIPDNESPLISIASDPELTGTSVQLIFRHPPIPDKYSDKYLASKSQYISSLANNMINNRLGEIAQKEDAPFLGAGSSYGEFIRTSDAYYMSGSARDGEALRTLEALETELLRIKRGGFTASELERAKTDIIRGTERYYENRNDMKNGEFSGKYMQHFEDGTPYITPETDREVTHRVIDNITLAEVEATVRGWISDRNRIITISLPEKEGVVIPTEGDVMAMLKKVAGSEIDIFVDNVKNEPLITAELTGSPVVKTSQGEHGSTIMQLKNGVRVIFKPSTLKADEVIMSSFQRGGSSTITDVVDLYNLSMLSAYMGSAGVGEFSAVELGKKLNGKIAGASPSISGLSQGISGSCSPKDLETMMQLVYLNYTAPRFDQSDWNVVINQFKTRLPNMITHPSYALQDTLLRTMYGNDPRVFMQMSSKVLDTVSMQRTAELYRQFFSNAYGMTFVVVGNVSIDSLRPLAEKYLGSLPSKKQQCNWGDNLVEPRSGINQNMFKTKLETPKVTAIEIFTGKIPFTTESSVNMAAMRYILELRYTKAIREEKGGTYGVGVSMSYSKTPKPQFVLQVSFVTDLSKIEELLPIVEQQIQMLSKDGATAEEITKTKEFFLKKFKEGLIQNGTWLGVLTGIYFDGVNTFDGYEAAVEALTPESIQKITTEVYDQNNVCTVVQMPLEDRSADSAAQDAEPSAAQ